MLLQVNGVHINVEERQPQGGHPEETLVLLHGFTGSAVGWGSHLDRIAESGMRAVAIDLLGHGLSDAPADPLRYHARKCSQDIRAVLDQLDVPAGRAALLGYSMGGRMALHAAFSGFFRSLILESASPGLAAASARTARRRSDEALAERIECDGMGAFVSYWESLPLFASQRRLSVTEQAVVRAQRLNNRTIGLANSLRGAGTGVLSPLHRHLPDLRLPVLLISGELDLKYTAIAQEMGRALPNAQVEIVADAGHTVHLEQPEVFDRLIIQFCNRNSVVVG